MSVRTFDPKPIEIFPQPLCSEKGCGNPYHSICRLCNAAFCLKHLKDEPHHCDTHSEFLVLEKEEVEELFNPLRDEWTSVPFTSAPKNGNTRIHEEYCSERPGPREKPHCFCLKVQTPNLAAIMVDRQMGQFFRCCWCGNELMFVGVRKQMEGHGPGAFQIEWTPA